MNSPSNAFSNHGYSHQIEDPNKSMKDRTDTNFFQPVTHRHHK
jgi:hypothetical protein